MNTRLNDDHDSNFEALAIDVDVDTESTLSNVPNERAGIIQKYFQDIRSGGNALPLSEEVALFRQAAAGDKAAKDRLITSNLSLVAYIARQYQNRGLPLSDLISEGSLGLIYAMKKFDPDKGFRFFTYASWWVQDSIRKALAESRQIYLPHYLIKPMGACLRAKRNGKTDVDTAKELNISVADVQKFLLMSRSPESLDHPERDELPDSHTISPIDQILLQEQNHLVKAAMAALTERQRFVLRKRYGFDDEDPMSLDEIAKLMTLSRESVRIILNDALKTFKKHFNHPRSGYKHHAG